MLQSYSFSAVHYFIGRQLLSLVVLLSPIFIASADTLVATGSEIILIDDITRETTTLIDSAGAGMYYDPTTEYLYFAGPDNSIKRADRDGSNIVTIIADVGIPVGDLVVDTVNNKIIWTEPFATRIRRSNLNGSGIEEIVSGISLPDGLVIDEDTSKIYWGTVGGVEKANLDGTDYQTVYMDFETFPMVSKLSLHENTLYLADSSNELILAVEKDGSNPRTVLSGISAVAGIEYSAASEQIYFIGTTGGASLQTYKFTDGNPVLLKAVNGTDIISHYVVSDETEEVADPVDDEPVASTPAPEELPRHSRMYVSVANTDGSGAKLHWFDPYGTIKDALNMHKVEGMGFAMEKNLMLATGPIFGIEIISAVDLSNNSVQNIRSHYLSEVRYDTLYADEEQDRMYFAGNGRVDFCHNFGMGKCYNLQISPTTFRGGFAAVGNYFYWMSGQKVYRMTRNNHYYDRVTHYASFSISTVKAVSEIENGMLILYQSDSNLYLGHFFAEETPEFLRGDVYLGESSLGYNRIAVQHLDPDVYEIPYAIYLAGENKLDVLYFTPQPVLIPFHRFQSNQSILSIAEMPIDGAGEPLFQVGAKQITGKLTFTNSLEVDAATNTSLAGVSVHIQKINSKARTATPEQTTFVTQTNENGEYYFRNIPKGDYKVTFERSDLKFSGKSINAATGEEAPPVLAYTSVDTAECNTTDLTKTSAQADLKLARLARLALREGKKGFKSRDKKEKKRIVRASKKINSALTNVLAKSRPLPTALLECSEQTTCELVSNQSNIQAYNKSIKRLQKASMGFIRNSTGAAPSTKITKRVNSLSKAAKKIIKSLPEQNYYCSPEQETVERDEELVVDLSL